MGRSSRFGPYGAQFTCQHPISSGQWLRARPRLWTGAEPLAVDSYNQHCRVMWFGSANSLYFAQAIPAQRIKADTVFVHPQNSVQSVTQLQVLFGRQMALENAILRPLSKATQDFVHLGTSPVVGNIVGYHIACHVTVVALHVTMTPFARQVCGETSLCWLINPSPGNPSGEAALPSAAKVSAL